MSLAVSFAQRDLLYHGECATRIDRSILGPLNQHILVSCAAGGLCKVHSTCSEFQRSL